MSPLMRGSLLGVAVLGTAFIVVQLDRGQALWQHCFDMLDRSFSGTQLDYPATNPSHDTWRFALAVLVLRLGTALLLAAPMLPTIAAIALARRSAIAWLTLAPMAFVILVAHEAGGLHDCDRKGCNGCFAVSLLMLFLQLPLGVIALIFVGLERLWRRRARSAS
jgi:hypothetical protein